MAEHPYEYSFMNLFLAPKPGRLPDYTTSQVQGEVTQQLGKLAERLPKVCEKSPDGKTGWTINSHSLSAVGGLVMITILLQRIRS